MNETNEKNLELINKLPDYMIEELQEANFFTYKRSTIATIINFFNKKMNITLSPISFSYTDEVSDVIESLY